MKALYTLSHAIVPAGSPATVDLVISFKAAGSAAPAVRRPLNLSLVLDRSGSMAGQSLKYAIRAAQNLVDHLAPQDLLSVVIYDDDVDTILAPTPVTDKAAIKALIGKVRAGGCTNLSGGWLKGCAHVQAKQSRELVQRVLLLTDGQANSGITDPAVLIKTAQQRADAGVITTTLGFGRNFNEDLLIGMANAAGGNFYFIQSPEDAADIFGIELESLATVAAQNLTVTLDLAPGVQVAGVLNSYRSTAGGSRVTVAVGDVYTTEDKLLALELQLPAQPESRAVEVANVAYSYQAIVDGSIQEGHGAFPVAIRVGEPEETSAPDATLIEQTSRLRIARAKDEAVADADAGNYAAASQKLRATIADVRRKLLHESFELAEELDQLDYYAQRIESQNFDTVSRKELRDQSYQARARNRADLALRGASSGSARGLDTVTTVDSGVVVHCSHEGGKLRVRVISDGYDQQLNVQFPRAIREAGVTYVVDEVRLSADGAFYRTVGAIRRLVLPGEEGRYASGGQPARRSGKPQAASAAGTAADLDTTNDIGEGVLVQCVRDGSKLRARVVSDGYDPNFNMRFPRGIREEGTLYVVDDVIEAGSGGSYIACGKIRRFVQA